MSTPTAPTPFSLSPELRLTLPIVTLIALLTGAALAYSTWAATQTQVVRNTSDIAQIKIEAAAGREILIRIDENVKQLKLEASQSRKP